MTECVALLSCGLPLVSEQDRPAMQLYQPGTRNRKRLGSAGKAFDCPAQSPEHCGNHCYYVTLGTGSEKSGDK